MKCVFIINPASGKTDYSVIKDNIKRVFKNKDYEILVTKCPGEATKIASRYKDNKKVIVYSVGGDGTLNEVVNGLVYGKCKLGIIPTGSGNDFYRCLNNYQHKNKKIDLGKVNGKYFINISSVGIDAETCNNANKIKSKFKTGAAYYLGLIHTFFHYKSKLLKIYVDGKLYVNKYMSVAVCNGKYYGGGFKIAPLASFDDNYFDVYLIEKMNRFRLIKVMVGLLKGKHESYSEVKKFRATSVKIISDKNLIVNVDGEIMASKILEFELVKDSLFLYNDEDIVRKVMRNKA